MNKKLTIEEIRKLANSKQLPLKPKPVKIPENIKKYDKIYMLPRNLAESPRLQLLG